MADFGVCYYSHFFFSMQIATMMIIEDRHINVYDLIQYLIVGTTKE